MNKTERLTFIESLIKHNSAGSMQVDKGGIEQEAKLAKANDSDESILDEEQQGANFISPLLAVAIEKPRLTKEREEDSIISKSDVISLSRELGRPISFLKLKQTINVEEELSRAQELNFTELSAFARAQEIAMDKADAEKNTAS
jgi:hypothetical protein